MSRTTLLQERRMQTFQNVLGHWQARRLSALEAAEMLGMSERSSAATGAATRTMAWTDCSTEGSTRRPRAACRPTGSNGCSSSTEPAIRAGRSSTSTTISAPTTASPGATPGPKTTLQRAGLVSKAPRRGAHRRRRPRKPCVGMMLHQDGSRHEWLAGQAACDLIVTMDDATSEIYSAFLSRRKAPRPPSGR